MKGLVRAAEKLRSKVSVIWLLEAVCNALDSSLWKQSSNKQDKTRTLFSVLCPPFQCHRTSINVSLFLWSLWLTIIRQSHDFAWHTCTCETKWSVLFLFSFIIILTLASVSFPLHDLSFWQRTASGNDLPSFGTPSHGINIVRVDVAPVGEKAKDVASSLDEEEEFAAGFADGGGSSARSDREPDSITLNPPKRAHSQADILSRVDPPLQEDGQRADGLAVADTELDTYETGHSKRDGGREAAGLAAFAGTSPAESVEVTEVIERAKVGLHLLRVFLRGLLVRFSPRHQLRVLERLQKHPARGKRKLLTFISSSRRHMKIWKRNSCEMMNCCMCFSWQLVFMFLCVLPQNSLLSLNLLAVLPPFASIFSPSLPSGSCFCFWNVIVLFFWFCLFSADCLSCCLCILHCGALFLVAGSRRRKGRVKISALGDWQKLKSARWLCKKTSWKA